MLDLLTFIRLLLAALFRLGAQALRERNRIQNHMLPGDRLTTKLSLSFDVEVGAGAGSIGEIVVSTG